jgi:hypothetical protein
VGDAIVGSHFFGDRKTAVFDASSLAVLFFVALRLACMPTIVLETCGTLLISSLTVDPVTQGNSLWLGPNLTILMSSGDLQSVSCPSDDRRGASWRCLRGSTKPIFKAWRSIEIKFWHEQLFFLAGQKLCADDGVVGASSRGWRILSRCVGISFGPHIASTSTPHFSPLALFLSRLLSLSARFA